MNAVDLTRRFTVVEVLRLVEAGILDADEPYELLEGRLVEVGPQGPEHAGLISAVADRLRAAYAGAYVVREEKPLVAGTDSLPEPDIAVVRVDHATLRTRHPHAGEAVLVIESAFSSQSADRKKASTYALAGVPVYWLVDGKAQRIEVLTEPQADGRYGVVTVLSAGDTLALPELPATWPVLSLFR